MHKTKIINFILKRGDRADAFYIHRDGAEVEKMLMVHPDVITEELDRVLDEMQEKGGTLIVRVYTKQAIEVYGFAVDPETNHELESLPESILKEEEGLLAWNKEAEIDTEHIRVYRQFQ